MSLLNRNIKSSSELGRALLKMIEENLDVAHWGFQSSYTNFMDVNSLLAIYDSSWCRISFSFSRQQISSHDELSIDYGRLHALNEEPYMEWQGKESRCWHNIVPILFFLDGLTALEAVQQEKVKKQAPLVIENFKHSEIGRQLFNEYPPKAQIVMHSIIWHHYGEHLFELFDLRKPRLWESYRNFIKEYYTSKRMKASYGPPYEDIC